MPLGLLGLLGCFLAYFLSGKREPAVQTAKDVTPAPARVDREIQTAQNVPPAPARKGEVREAARPTYDTGDAGRKLTRVSLPGGASLDVREGSALDGIVKYVEDPSGSRPNIFVFEGLGFNANNAVSFSPEASARIGNLATILKAFPTARLKIEGHTDDVGDPATNRRLSLDRADAIKRLLVRAGVPAERITTEGGGPDRPIATNDTEDGRAKNRRIELAVATEMTRISLPGGASLDVREGSALDGIVKYVEDPSGSRPNIFVFEGLGFNANNAVSFSPEASARIGNLATILKAFPTARLKIEGHTDDVGDPATNRRLSLDRADAIKRLLVRAGVPAERITTEGGGPDRPIATNDTEDGRAKNRRIELAVATEMTRISLPGGASLDVREGSALDGIVKYVEDPSGSRPNIFVFEGLGFNANNAVSFSPEASARIGNLATILKAFPTARLKIEGHTDDVGDPATNRRLSLDRADAIKRLLVRAGVPAERITTEGVGPDRPIATNDTEDGRAKNRRIELAITVK